MPPKIEEIDDADDMPELEEDSTAETGAAPGVRTIHARPVEL